jgi:hypothetical protein
MELKLNFELVPDGCWGSNLRNILPKKAWDILRKDAKVRSGGKCAICGKKTDKLDAHERWSYDKEKGVQKLEDIIAVCKDCHSVIHIGFTQLRGNEQRAEAHFIKVNECTYADYIKALGEANERHRELNKVSEWALDLTYLAEYNGK